MPCWGSGNGFQNSKPKQKNTTTTTTTNNNNNNNKAMVRVGRRESDGDVASRPALKWRVGRRSAVSRTAQSGKSDGAEWRVDRRSSAESAGDMMLHGSKQPKLAK